MRHDKLERELQLLLLLIENYRYTVPEICEKIGISRRNLYYYLEFFRDAGFIVENHRPYYLIRKDSPWFKKIDAAVHFTEDEAILMRRLLEKVDDGSQQIAHLLRKLDKLYDLDIINPVEIRERQAANASVIYEAIKQKRVVVLKNYASPHSDTVSDRRVEPFLFMNGNQDVRCYEYASKMNKTFKLSRIQEVEMLDLSWSNESKHINIHTDIFMFSAEEEQIVKLRMGRLSTYILREEYPKSERYIEQEDESHWLCELPVCSFLGIGRFVIGLMEDIEVLENEAFRQYLKERVKRMSEVKFEK
ncbi:MAG: WYL domain-containing protein [Prevotella sp.]|nr:WYL domain-containing protein [Prevotella sp.]